MDYEMSIKKYLDFVRSEQREMIPHKLTDVEKDFLALSNALGGEIGELQNVVKKILSKDQFLGADDPIGLALWNKFADEAGDALWYLFRLIDRAGYPIENIMQANIAKLTKRYKEGDTWRK